MKRIWIPAISALILVGCAAQDSGEDAGSHEAETPTTDASASAETETETAVDAVTANVTMTGTLGCAHCTFEVGNSCATAMKTADEIVHILEGTDDAVFEDRYSGREITVVGAPREDDGMHYVTVETWEL